MDFNDKRNILKELLEKDAKATDKDLNDWELLCSFPNPTTYYIKMTFADDEKGTNAQSESAVFDFKEYDESNEMYSVSVENIGKFFYDYQGAPNFSLYPSKAFKYAKIDEIRAKELIIDKKQIYTPECENSDSVSASFFFGNDLDIKLQGDINEGLYYARLGYYYIGGQKVYKDEKKKILVGTYYYPDLGYSRLVRHGDTRGTYGTANNYAYSPPAPSFDLYFRNVYGGGGEGKISLDITKEMVENDKDAFLHDCFKVDEPLRFNIIGEDDNILEQIKSKAKYGYGLRVSESATKKEMYEIYASFFLKRGTPSAENIYPVMNLYVGFIYEEKDNNGRIFTKLTWPTTGGFENVNPVIRRLKGSI